MTAFLSRIAPYKGIQTSESGKFLLVESGIRKTSRFVGRALKPGIQLKKSGIQYLESGF